MWTIAIPQSNFKDGKFHEFQKPRELLERIIEIGSKPGDLVYDPFMGSGTTAIAAQNLGRRWIGSELKKEHVETIIRRTGDALQYNV